MGCASSQPNADEPQPASTAQPKPAPPPPSKQPAVVEAPATSRWGDGDGRREREVSHTRLQGSCCSTRTARCGQATARVTRAAGLLLVQLDGDSPVRV